MLSWIKRKATQAAANQCKVNIRFATKTLVSVSNKADENIHSSGGITNDSDVRKVVKAQKGLLTDIILGHSNELTIEEMRTDVISPVLEQLVVSEGASLAVEHVIETATKECMSL